MDLESRYDIGATADHIRSHGYTRVVLQFPDDMLKDSSAVVKALKHALGFDGAVKLYVMADTVYNSCCIDEVSASHVHADCVVHYGNACMSPTSSLPAFFVFGKAPLDLSACAEALSSFLSKTEKPILVLYALEYAYAIKKLEAELDMLCCSSSRIQFAEPCSSTMCPTFHNSAEIETEVSESNDVSTLRYSLGGITWCLSVEQKMDNFILFWIGNESPAFTNIVLTHNNCEIVRYDTIERQLYSDASHIKKILKRRYYLIEKAKDASIVGILVGTLGVAGNLHVIQKMKALIEGAGKKSYTIVMGRPNAAKLANFPECEVFVYVSCAQTALLDSKEFLAPVITPFEALLAFSRNNEWTGEYSLDFQHLNTSDLEVADGSDEPRFSFIKGHYVHHHSGDNKEESGTSLVLAEAVDKSLSIRNQNSDTILFQGSANSALEYLKARPYQGLTGKYESPAPQKYVTGRSGRAAVYENEQATSSH